MFEGVDIAVTVTRPLIPVPDTMSPIPIVPDTLSKLIVVDIVTTPFTVAVDVEGDVLAVTVLPEEINQYILLFCSSTTWPMHLGSWPFDVRSFIDEELLPHNVKAFELSL